MQALSSWLVRHRLIVSLLWLALTAVGVFIAPSVSGRLHSGVSLSSPAYTANQQIARHYGGATSPPGLVTINLRARQTVRTPAVRARLAKLDAQLATAPPPLPHASYRST